MKKTVLPAILIGLLFLSGCDNVIVPKYQNYFHGSEEAVLYLGPLSEPEMGFDPIAGWANVDGVSIFHSSLLTQDTNMNIVEDLAESYSVSEDGLSYTFSIREDAEFSDGGKVKSRDVAFTYDQAAKSGKVGNLSWVDFVETPDERTVVIHLKKPNSLFLYSVTRLGIVPEDLYGRNYYRDPVGSGPYKLERWEPGERLIAKANPNYYGKKPFLKTVTVLFLDEQEAYEAARSGKLDFYSVSRSFANENIPGMDLLHFKSADRLNISLPNLPAGKVTRTDGLPVGNDITSDQAVRHAINVGIDREAITDQALSQYGKPAYDPVDEEMPWYNEETSYKDGNTDLSKTILKSGGWIDTDADGIVEKNGMKAEFDLYAASDNKTYQQVAYMIAEQVRAFGIKINVRIKSWDEIDKLRYADPFVLLWGSLSPINIEYLYYSPNAGNGYFNSAYYKNDTVDEYIMLALHANSDEEANKYWKAAQWDGHTGFSNRGDAGWLWIASMDHIFRVKAGLNIGEQGIQNASNGWAIMHNIEEWKWDQK
ncbi:MAG: ABC transporter substrate-binding protein [Peptostreptococcaceae bacterium]|nr:ABC transporter substrate-binding protein [Peptostreptococcaceae bacterium]